MRGRTQGYVYSVTEENMAKGNSQKDSFLHNRGHKIELHGSNEWHSTAE